MRILRLRPTIESVLEVSIRQEISPKLKWVCTRCCINQNFLVDPYKGGKMGVPACDHVKETSNATEDEEPRGIISPYLYRQCLQRIEPSNIEWWMRKRQLPVSFRQRVRNYKRQHWAAVRGVDECEMTRNLPEGLRRDIKYHLCLDLVRQVPLFQHMDNLVLENICDRVKSLIFTKGETITREGDPVQRMVFIVRGHLQSSQVLRDGVKSCCMLGPGNFSGDELLSWCLRRPFIERLPPSSSTSLSFIRPRRPLSRSSSLGEDRLRLYMALLTSPKPNQDDFNF